MGNYLFTLLQQMGGHHASTQEQEHTTSIQANSINNSKTYDNEFGQNNIHTGAVGAGGSVFLQDLGFFGDLWNDVKSDAHKAEHFVKKAITKTKQWVEGTNTPKQTNTVHTVTPVAALNATHVVVEHNTTTHHILP